jgi:hypothetical protein
MPACFPNMQPLVIDHNPFVFVKPKTADNQFAASHVTPDTGFMVNSYTNRPTQLLARAPGGTSVRSSDPVTKVYLYSIQRP